MTSHMSAAIKESSYRNKTIEFITANAKWPNTKVFHAVDWQAREQASKGVKRDNKLTIFKLEFGYFATMHRRHKMEPNISRLCPRCQSVCKNFDHVLQCQEDQSTTLAAWLETRKQIMSKDTCPAILKQLEAGFLSRLTGETHGTLIQARRKASDPIDRLIDEAINKQQVIGWGQAFCGWLSTKCGKAQEAERWLLDNQK